MVRISALLVLMVAAVCVIAEVSTDGLVAAYTFNGTNPWRDVSGNGHDLSVVDPAFAPLIVNDSSAAWEDNLNPYRNKVLYFKPNDRRISALKAIINTLPKGEESRTICLWLKIPHQSNINAVIFSYGTAQNVFSVIDTSQVIGSPRLIFSYYMKGYPTASFSNYKIQKDYINELGGTVLWQLVLLTYDYAKGQAYLKVGADGEMKSLVCPSPEALESFILGGATRGFNGYIDDIYIYNRVLKWEEVYFNENNKSTCIELGKGTLNIPTQVTMVNRCVKVSHDRKSIHQVYTIDGKKCTKKARLVVNKGLAKIKLSK